jgi:hypothetical protein
MVATMKRQYVFSSTAEEDLKHSWLSIQIRDPMMKRRSGISRTWNLQETPWTQEIMKIPRKKEKPEQPVIVSRLPA